MGTDEDSKEFAPWWLEMIIRIVRNCLWARVPMPLEGYDFKLSRECAIITWLVMSGSFLKLVKPKTKLNKYTMLN